MPTTIVKTIKSSGGDFSSLSAWEAARQADLTVADTIEQADVYGFSDTTGLTIAGWTTDATRYAKISSPVGQRHAGKPDLTKANLKAQINAMVIQQNFTRVEYMQVLSAIDDNGRSAISVSFNVEARIEKCLCSRVFQGSYSFGNNSHCIDLGTDRTVNVYVINTAVYDWSFGAKTGIVGVSMTNGNGPPGKAYLDNCLAHCTTGIGYSDGFSDIVAKNCIAYNCNDGFSGSFDASSDYNASTLSADAPGTHARNSQTFTFVDATNFDFHLTSGDAGAKGFGTSLAADSIFPFSDDFDGDTRSLWSIGPDDGPASTARAKSLQINQSIVRSNYW